MLICVWWLVIRSSRSDTETDRWFSGSFGGAIKIQIDVEVGDFVDRNDSRWVMFGKWARCRNAGNFRGQCLKSSTFRHWQPLNPDPISYTLHPHPVPRTLNPTSSSQITDSQLLILGLMGERGEGGELRVGVEGYRCSSEGVWLRNQGSGFRDETLLAPPQR